VSDQAPLAVLQGRLDEAEKYLNQALEQAKLGFGEHDQHVASSYQNLVRRWWCPFPMLDILLLITRISAKQNMAGYAGPLSFV
jgi:hypothetical protein